MAKYIPEDTCLIFVGSTGCGKSTLVNELATQSVATSSSAESCTWETACYSSSLNNIKLMDTIGAEDSHGMSNREIFESICTKLAPLGTPNVKIFWIISPNIKQSQELQRQARFINSLSKGSIWKSVSIIAKQGSGSPKKTCQGAIASATGQGYNGRFEIPCFNLHILDLIDKDELEEDMTYRFACRQPISERCNGCTLYLYKREIKNWFVKSIDNIVSTQVEMRKEYYHDGKIDKEMYHPGHYKMGFWNKTGFWVLGIATAGIGNAIAAMGDGHELCRQWRCCGNVNRYAAACTIKRQWWTCCNKSIGRRGCKSKWVPK